MRAMKCGIGLMALGGLLTAPLQAQDLLDLFGDAPQGKELEALIEAAEAHPLGSDKNPVRAEMPSGQRAYLSRLRCADGDAPAFERIGSQGIGVYGRITDAYDVTCEGSKPDRTVIILDMYHPGHVENQAVNGFTIAGK